MSCTPHHVTEPAPEVRLELAEAQALVRRCHHRQRQVRWRSSH